VKKKLGRKINIYKEILFTLITHNYAICIGSANNVKIFVTLRIVILRKFIL